jgi:hypothetical protein
LWPYVSGYRYLGLSMLTKPRVPPVMSPSRQPDGKRPDTFLILICAASQPQGTIVDHSKSDHRAGMESISDFIEVSARVV